MTFPGGVTLSNVWALCEKEELHEKKVGIKGKRSGTLTIIDLIELLFLFQLQQKLHNRPL